MVSRALTESKGNFFIVDLMPNLKWMLNNPLFIKECSEEFKFFQEKVGISAVTDMLVFLNN